jgi:alpha-glucosidase (family GH31 glycosyl hydrolase)
MIDITSPFFDRIRIQGKPLATSASLVVCGQARFTILTSRLIRLEWLSGGEFEDRGTFAFPNRDARVPVFTQTLAGNQLTIKTQDLYLQYTDDGSLFNSSNLSIEFDLDGQKMRWTPGMVNQGNLRGTRRTLDQCAAAAGLQEGILSRDGWSLFDDSGSPVWDIEQRWVESRSAAHVQDWYFFGYGHDYKAALREYVQFGGPIPMVPRYVLGAWWSRFWAYHADDLKQLVKEFQDHEVPLDVLVVDMDWHTPDGWTGYTWNRQLFPDPEAFLAWAHEQNLYVTLNLHPADGIQKHEAAYGQMAQLLGRDPALGEGIKFTCTDPSFIQHYFELLHHPMEDQGVDFWWLDWQQGESTEIRNLDPLPWLNHLHFQDSRRRNRRPMLYSRWGGLGNHRYPIGFSGDTYATWESLQFQPYFTATAANVGYGWWSHDIGGHFGATDPELYARWVQYGAVSPCLRLHSTKDPLAERRPWAFSPEIYAAAKAAIQFRYELLPYLYSAARTASQQGLALCTPMYYEYPDAEDAYLARGQYFLGDQVIAAPIVTPVDPQTGLASVDVWLPEGNWIEYTILETFSGPRWVRIEGDLNRIPMFARAGAILPMAPQIMRTQEFDGSYIKLALFPGADGQFEFYEDEAVTEGYKQSAYETTLIRSAFQDRSVTISIAPAVGNCPTLPATRTFEVHLRGVNRANQITFNGSQHTAWAYDNSTCELTITLENTDRREAMEISVQAEQSLLALTPAPSGAPFVHVVDYDLFDDAKHQLGTVVIAPAADNTPFDAEITWQLQKGSTTSVRTAQLKNVSERQILHCPFADDSSLSSFRWSVSVKSAGQSQTLDYHYQSREAYPSITRWQTLVYNRDMQDLKPAIVANNPTDPALHWLDVAQPIPEMLNIQQPFGVILLEKERQRISAGEALEACVRTTLVSQSHQEVMLAVQCVGEHSCSLNGIELQPTAPIQHTPMQPMFYSWMPPQYAYYSLPLQAGSNALTIFTRPTGTSGWWGVGATLLDQSGSVITNISATPQEG